MNEGSSRGCVPLDSIYQVACWASLGRDLTVAWPLSICGVVLCEVMIIGIERGKARKQPDVAGKTIGVLSGRAGIIGEGVQA